MRVNIKVLSNNQRYKRWAKPGRQAESMPRPSIVVPRQPAPFFFLINLSVLKEKVCYQNGYAAAAAQAPAPFCFMHSFVIVKIREVLRFFCCFFFVSAVAVLRLLKDLRQP